jgi:hypothetical protein
MSSRHLALLHGIISPPLNFVASKPERDRPPQATVIKYAKTDVHISKLEEALQMGAILLGDKRRKGSVAWAQFVR